jgi:hypothetical protein
MPGAVKRTERYAVVSESGGLFCVAPSVEFTG